NEVHSVTWRPWELVEEITTSNGQVTLHDIAGIYAHNASFIEGILTATLENSTLTGTLVTGWTAKDYYDHGRAYLDPCITIYPAKLGTIKASSGGLAIVRDAVIHEALEQMANAAFRNSTTTE